MNGHSSAAINVSRGCVTPLERSRSTYSRASEVKRSCKSTINVVSGLVHMKVETRNLEEVKRFELNSTCSKVRGSYSERYSPSLKQPSDKSKPLGLTCLRVQQSSASNAGMSTKIRTLL
ncbi:hypothetical protein O6H91_Y278600 [Diphasiastrum complanatum]|nr:hypothetical protein O6H91_Y278600 [Diphasiastrum complanatum]